MNGLPTSTRHLLPFDALSPSDFERLCLWLVLREGYERVEHFGAAGGDQGRDLVAWQGGRRVVFQCKRVQRFGAAAARAEVAKILALPPGERPARLVFVVTAAVGAAARQAARRLLGDAIECELWCGAELDARAKRHADLLAEFFGSWGDEPVLELFEERRRKGAKAAAQGETAALLRPWSRAVPLIGRKRETAHLWRWLDAQPPVSVRVLTARAGGGKTRLALELCLAAASRGWAAGFLTEQEQDRLLARHVRRWAWRRPTLVVVDDAAARVRQLTAWLAELADHPGWEGRPLRVLLLERHAEPGTGWWREVFELGPGDRLAVRQLLDPAEPVTLPPLGSPPERLEILAATMACAGSAVRPPPPGESPGFDHELAGIPWGGEPLFLMMAALTAARDGLSRVLALSRTDLALIVAEHELARVRRAARDRGLPEGLAVHIAALATLCQGLTRPEVLELLEQEGRALGEPVANPALACRVLAAVLPGDAGSLAPISPHVVGEAALLLALGDGVREVAREAAVRAVQRAGGRVAAVAARAAQDLADRSAEPVAWLTAMSTALWDDTESLAVLVAQLPWRTVVLRTEAARLARRLVERTDPADGGLLAARLDLLAHRLGEIGEQQAALEANLRSVALYRSLAIALPAFEKDLAFALSNASFRFARCGNPTDALRAAVEAVAKLRGPAVAPEVSRLHLPAALFNLADGQTELGCSADALAVAEEAQVAVQELAASDPQGTKPLLASAAHLLAITLGKRLRLEEALAACTAAVDLRRELVAAHPDAYRPALAGSLRLLGSCARALGRPFEALVADEQAVALARALSAAQPRAFSSLLLETLDSLAGSLADVGREAEALAAAQETVCLARSLAAQEPQAHESNLAEALITLAVLASEAGSQEEAVAAAEESVARHRALAAAQPAAFRPALARSLGALSHCQRNQGRWEDARSAAAEGVDLLLSQGAGDAEDAARYHLLQLLIALGNALGELKEWRQADPVFAQAVDFLQPLVNRYRGDFGDDLAGALSGQSVVLRHLGRHSEAEEAAAQAVTLYRASARSSRRVGPFLAGALHNLSLCLGAGGSGQRALAAAEEATALYRAAAANSPAMFRSKLVLALEQLAALVHGAGRSLEARPIFEEALHLSVPRADRSRVLFRFATYLNEVGRPDEALAAIDEVLTLQQEGGAAPDELAFSLFNRGYFLGALGRHEEGLDSCREAVRRLRELAERDPEAFRPHLLQAVAGCLHQLRLAQRPREALAAAEEAVTLLRELTAGQEGVYLPALARMCNHQADLLQELGEPGAALPAAEEATALFRKLAAGDPATFEPHLAGALSTVATCQGGCGRVEAAFVAISEAVRLLQPYAKAYKESHRAWLDDVADIYRRAARAAAREPEAGILASLLAEP